MKTAGIISEYNPFHRGHYGHIEKTRAAVGGQCAIVCAMSGNFVQRGDFAIFNKHARAKAAILGGADLVVEIPSPYVLSSAEGFAAAGVHILDKLGVCEYISFGSESGDIGMLGDAAAAIVSEEAVRHLKDWLGRGLSYASSQQKAADAVLGRRSEIFRSPNNLLGIEYIKAINESGSLMRPLTVKREGGAHDAETGCCASALRKMMLRGETQWELMPETGAAVFKDEIAAGRGPVSMKQAELAILSRLRFIGDFSCVQGSSEGLDRRFMRYAASEPAIDTVLGYAKTKRYAMSRLRRMMLCACLGIMSADTKKPPPYIRVLAMNRTGMILLKTAQKKAQLPVIIKPATAHRLQERAAEMFCKESAATDFYTLAYPDENKRSGGGEWRQTPVIINN